jgi:hypothetical protein
MLPSPPTITLEEVLRNNRFAVLATMHDPPPRKPKKMADARLFYNIKLGEETIRLDGVVGVGSAAVSNTTVSSTPSFFGQCYNCRYKAHLQKHCPLQQCGRCGKFGHGTHLCQAINAA